MKTHRKISSYLGSCILGLLLLTATTGSATVVISYDAGTNGTPALAPDPASVEGGGWWWTNVIPAGFIPGTMFAGSFSPDNIYTNHNARRTLDFTNTAGGNSYIYHPSATERQKALWAGYKLTARLKVLDPVAANAGSVAVFMSCTFTNEGIRHSTFWDLAANGDLQLAPHAVAAAGRPLIATAASGNATNYHTYEIAYDPATLTADYRADGVTLTNRAHVVNVSPASHGVQWGTGSTGGRGDGYWQIVKFEVNEIAPIVVTLNPTNVTKKVSQAVTFNANFTGACTNLQWFKDGNPVFGTGYNQRSYTIPVIVPGDAGSYQLGMADPVGGTNVLTTGAVLTVNTDTNAPVVTGVEAVLTMRHVLVKFDEGVDPTTALNTANYSFQGGAATVLGATLADLSTVRLKTSLLAPNAPYTLSISNVQDLSANPIVGTNLNFTALNLLPVCAYDAGSNAVVASAPDPTSTNGGLWRLNQTGSGCTFANTSPDVAGLNGWNLDDQASNNSRVQYFYQFPQVSHTNAFANGWRLHARARFLNDYNTVQTMHLQYCDPTGKRYVLFWDLAGINVDLYLILNPNGAPANGGLSTNVTTGGVGANDYHDVDIVFNPATGKGECYYNGDFLFGNWNGDVSTAFSGAFIGNVSDPGLGSINLNQFDFSVVNATNVSFTEPATTLAVNAGEAVTLSRAYTGFLATCQWRKNGIDLPGGNAARQATYTIASVTDADEGAYTLEAHNSFAQTESAVINLVVRPTISLVKSGSDVVVSWTGTLQACDTVGGTYTNVVPTPTSPLILSNPAQQALFFRCVKP